MSLFGFLLPEELRGLDRGGFDVAIGARELSAEWISYPLWANQGGPRWRKRIKTALI
jgi:hypothetical protein